MYIILSILILVSAVMLVGIILIQKSKGGGLAAGFSGYNSMAGVRQTTNFVEKATWGLAIFICALSIASCFIAPRLINAAPQIKQLPVAEQQATPFEAPAQPAQPAQPAK
ncbi:MAG: preprotein translocase subunit SecG [Muribaculaceae bacterium]|nr:preprotein translocase subunit SecG [Muribaculaceae bacterium]